MRLGLVRRNPVVWLLDVAGILPTPLLVGFWGMESSRALIAATELGVFDALAERPRSARELASDLGYDEVGVEALLNALNGFGYLKRRSGRLVLTRQARRWLTSDAKYSMVEPMALYGLIWHELDDLEERVRHGGRRDFHRAERGPDFWERYESGLGRFAQLTAPTIAKRIQVPANATRLLDVGGGHAAYSVAMARRHPGLQVTVLDLEPATHVGRRLVAESEVADRVEFMIGDLTKVEWGDGYDVVLLFNVLHVLSPEAASDAVERAYRTLAPGGTIAVLDSVHRGHRRDIDATGGGSELLFYAINGTRSYPEETIVAWVEAAGFESVRSQHLLGFPEVLICARRPKT